MNNNKIKLHGWLEFIILFNLFFLGCLLPSAVNAQQPGNAPQEEEDFIKPSRPGVANPAEIQKSGVLQVEFGYEADFRAEDFRVQQATPLNLRFAATSRLLLEFNAELVKSQTTEEQGIRIRETGFGDSRLGFQVVALKEKNRQPALAFAYYVKFPTADEDKRLGSGRTDHRAVALLSKKLGQNTDLDVNVAYLNIGREDSPRRADGGQFAVAVSHEFENDFGFELEVSGQSVEEAQPRGIYALGAITYKVNKRLRFDAGTRVGFGPEAPKFGVFAGFTLGALNLYGR